jgi:predicted GIY-YIG superfamily endonuclease
MPYFVYILRCCDDSLYTGRSPDPERRLSEHNLGIGGDYTSRRRPVVLVWSSPFESEQDAYVVERQIKGWTRAKKEALIAGDFDLLHELAVSSERKRREMRERLKAPNR